jgi:hypothetical protein
MPQAQAGQLNSHETAALREAPRLEIVPTDGTPPVEPSEHAELGLMDQLETPRLIPRTEANAHFFYVGDEDSHLVVAYHNSANIVAALALHAIMQEPSREQGVERRLSFLDTAGKMYDQAELLNPEEFLGTGNNQPREHRARFRLVDEEGTSIVFTRPIKDIYVLTIARRELPAEDTK